MSNVYLLVGGNKGNRLKYIKNAIDRIRDGIGNIIRISSFYETEPYGFKDKKQFLNICILVKTELTPHGILEILSGIEISLGRIRKADRYMSRCIDIDILFYDNIILNDTSLIIPHPEFHKRNFALIPMAEISPGFIHPVFGKTISSLLEESTDRHEVVLFHDQVF
jgi:2-amino-4-hydroxy-6-hydroxymethyldihydropteridine diphosphokinase